MILKRSFFIMCVCILYVYFLLLNWFEPLFADDFAYSFIFGKDEKIYSLFDILYSQYIHYQTWGGRIVAHSFGQFFLWIGKPIFNIINAFAYLALIHLIFLHSGSKLQIKQISVRDLYIYIFIFLLCWFGLPQFGETNIWLIGSVNYLWTIDIVLLFLLPFRKIIIDTGLNEKIETSSHNKLFLLVLGLLAGWTNENIASVVILMIIIGFFYLKKIKKTNIPPWYYFGAVGLVIGFLLLILSPGNAKRSEIINYHPSIKQRVIDFIPKFMEVLIEQYVILVILLILIIINFNAFSKKPNGNIILGTVFFLAGLLSFGVMFASPIFPLRASYGGAVFLIIAAVYLLNHTLNIYWGSNLQKIIGYILTGSTIFLIVFMSQTFVGYIILGQQNSERVDIVKRALSQNSPTATFPLFDEGNRHVFVRDIDEPIFNHYFRKYYGLQFVIAENKQVLDVLMDDKKYLNLTTYLADNKSFSFMNDLTLINVKLVSDISNKEKYYMIFEFDKKINQNQLSNLRFFIDAYPANKDMERLQKNRRNMGFNNWDNAINIFSINNRMIMVTELDSAIQEYPKVEVGFYDPSKGRVGNVLMLENVQLLREGLEKD